MVSKASDDLPDPESPVTTVSVLRGIETERLRRLCCRAPRTVMCVIAMRIELAAHSTVPRGGEMANPQDTASGGAGSCPRSSGFFPDEARRAGLPLFSREQASARLHRPYIWDVNNLCISPRPEREGLVTQGFSLGSPRSNLPVFSVALAVEGTLRICSDLPHKNVSD